jgi:hypothetical protein
MRRTQDIPRQARVLNPDRDEPEIVGFDKFPEGPLVTKLRRLDELVFGFAV